MNKISKILIAAHDAGGAQILACLMKKYQDHFEWVAYTVGPARDIFNREGLKSGVVKTDNKSAIENIFKSVNPDLVLTGSGWASTLEIDFIKEAKSSSIKSAVFLDHWCNYRERFGYPKGWKSHLPDYVLVGDIWAYKIALKNRFSTKILKKVENPYWQGVEESINLRYKRHKLIDSSGKIRVLYLSSPITSHAKAWYGHERYWGFTEFDQLEDVADIIKNDEKLELRIRLHPAEPKKKYACLKLDESCFTDHQKTDLVEDCLQVDIIIGCDSMALVTGRMAGCYAISFITGKKHPSSLPQKDIIKVFSKQALSNRIKNFKRNNKIKFRSNSFFTQAFPEVVESF